MNRPEPTAEQRCVSCNQPFVFGPKSDAAANVWSIDGKKEVAISQTCERCFDFMFEDLEEDDSGDFCNGCNPEPTIGEVDSGTCASCGKALL